MTKISKRLKAIAEFVSAQDKLVDVGCDHGLLSIYLVENKKVFEVIASDINPNALQNAILNIKKHNLNIKTVLSDGIQAIDLKEMNTLILSGMGTKTILHILEDTEKIKTIKKLLIQSNNDHALLREKLNQKGYYLEEETYTYDKNKWYVTCKFIKSDKKNTAREIQYGFLNNLDYNNYLLAYNKKILEKIPVSSLKNKLKALKNLRKLEKAISRNAK